MDQFNIPVVLFTFKRVDKAIQVLDEIAKLRPKKMYILSDNGRNEQEILIVNDLRLKLEQRIDWECEIVKKYADNNIGVYENIGNGAKWVLEREESAIFLEDDNLPELSFFRFCEEMLQKYRDDSRILWVCGTNYLKKYTPEDNSSYVFTKHMLPCGWASWGHKFNKFYEGNMELWRDPYIKKRILFENSDKNLLKQDVANWDRELSLINKGFKPDSWDYQMSFTMRVHGLYAIVPVYNQITNIGVDLDSIHGGTSFESEMTRRFCGLESKALEFPLIHPKVVLTDLLFENLTAKIITLPFKDRFKMRFSLFLKKIFKIDIEKSFTEEIKKRINLN